MRSERRESVVQVREPERSYVTFDKSTWGPGPWQDEPDKVQFVDRATGLDCLIVRNHFGALCGYVGVTEEHPLFRKSYDETYEEGVDLYCHGGLTYSAFCQEGTDESLGICHVPRPGTPDQVWWFGFDCAHGGDFIPGMHELARSVCGSGENYRTIAYVREQIGILAACLYTVGNGGEEGR